MIKSIKKIVLKLILLFERPITTYATKWVRFARERGFKTSEEVFMELGTLPVFDHYYQPMINPKKHLRKSLREDRSLPGINLNDKGQLELLDKFCYNDELLSFPVNKKREFEFHYNNGSYEAGDAEYLYNMVRHFKPKKIIEIGSGFSTQIAIHAINNNKLQDTTYACKHICIEPYEQPWLEKLPIELVRKKVEEIDKRFFEELDSNDILFIDSSHIIRPQGDVLFEYLEVLPLLKPGVIVHIHDIFLPKDYPDGWVYNHVLWNEQYLLEAFLIFNDKFSVIGAVNYLNHNYYEKLASKCPILKSQPGREPGSFWMVRV